MCTGRTVVPTAGSSELPGAIAEKRVWRLQIFRGGSLGGQVRRQIWFYPLRGTLVPWCSNLTTVLRDVPSLPSRQNLPKLPHL